MFFLYMLGVILWVFLGLWPAFVAKRKGYSFILFLVLSWLVSWLLMLIIAYVIHDKTNTSKQTVAAA